MSDKIYYKEGYKYQLYFVYEIDTGITIPEKVETEFIVLQKNGKLTIKNGYAWDGASGPTIDTKSSMRGSLVHDALYQLMRLGLLDQKWREKADDILHNLCVEDGMWHVRAELWEEMVSCFAASCAKYGTEKPILEAP